MRWLPISTFTWILQILLLLSPVWSTEQNSTAKKIPCEQGIALPHDPIRVERKHKDRFRIPWAPRKNRCMWTLVGTETCEVELSCNIDIPHPEGAMINDSEEEDECGSAYLKVSDGTLGHRLFCGKQEIKGLRANQGLRDLFVRIEETGEAADKPLNTSRFYGGVNCTVKCGTPGHWGNRLRKNIKRSVDNRCICGLQNDGDRIVGGEDARLHEFPWLAAVVEAETRYPECGASVINDRWILSAAHCFSDDADKEPENIDILLHALILDQSLMENARENAEWGKKGSTKSRGWNLTAVTDEDEKSQRYRVERIINHPLFDSGYDYDYSLIKLEKKININGVVKEGQYDKAITPVCLPRADTTTWSKLLDGWEEAGEPTKFSVAGWGKALQNAGGSTRYLQKLEVPYIHKHTCRQYLPNRLTHRMLCAGFELGKKDSCVGDSGGPLTYQKPDTKQHQQVGIVSFGIGCAREKKPGIYAKTTEAAQWIDFHTSNSDAKWCKDSLQN